MDASGFRANGPGVCLALRAFLCNSFASAVKIEFLERSSKPSEKHVMSATTPKILPVTLPISVEQYSDLVAHGHFDQQTGQTELINGRITHMNPQGPQHASPIDILSEWSIEQTKRQFWVRVEKPILLPNSSSVPEPDIAWVTRQSYSRRHPSSTDVHLLIEASLTSGSFDTGWYP